MTKEQLKKRYQQYLTSDYYSVNDFYANPSIKKRQAEMRIKEVIKDENGFGYKVIGGNSSHFTAGWQKRENGKRYFIFETYNNTYKIEVYGYSWWVE